MPNHTPINTNEGSPHNFEPHCQGCMHEATSKVIKQQQQEYQHQYFREKAIEQPGQRRWGAESKSHHCRGQILSRTNIARTILLTATMRKKNPKLI
jgi:hypothetical protein